VAGKLRNASLPVLKNALGITLSQMSATVQAAKDAALVKRMQPGFNASDGMRSVELAERGIMGTANVFDGEFGLFRLFNRSSCNRGILLHELGRKFHGQDLSIKRYPASRCSHAPIEGTIDLVNKHNLKPEQIKSIVVEVAEGCRREAGDPYDLDKGWPQVNAQFNIPFGVAAAALWRDVFIEQVQNKATRDPELLKMAARVEVKARADTGEPTAYLPSTVTIRTIDGTEYRTIVSKLRGSPDLPLSWDEIVQERTMRCAQWGRRRLDAVQLSEIIEAAKNLEQLPDARQLLRHLT
jgi:2-methylcitrate dehydratase PrpD